MFCKTTHLLSELDNVISGMVAQFNSFCAPDGDMMYFSDTGATAISPDACQTFSAVKKTYRHLDLDQRRVSAIMKSCSLDLDVVSFTLSMICGIGSEE
jgi:hypothetical protein